MNNEEMINATKDLIDRLLHENECTESELRSWKDRAQIVQAGIQKAEKYIEKNNFLINHLKSMARNDLEYQGEF